MLFSTFWLDFLALGKSNAITIKNILKAVLRLNFLYLNFP